MKIKILIRIGSLRHGGAEKVLITLLNNLCPDKYDIDLLLNLYSGKYIKDVPSWVNLYYLNKGEMITTNRIQDIPIKAYRVIYQKLLKKYPKLLYKYILKDVKYDIEFAAIQGLAEEILNSPYNDSKKIVWIHNDLSNFPEYTNERLKSFFKFDHILVISEKINSFFLNIAENDTDKKKIEKIYNPIDSKEIKRLSLGNIRDVKSDNLKTFVSVGSLFPQKGFDRLIKVHRRLLDEGYNHKIWIIGSGNGLKDLSKLINELEVSNSFFLFGYKENPYPYFIKADYYILSSRYEGYPTVLFEAMIFNKSIIATDVSGVREMLNNGKLGYIVDNTEEGIYLGMKCFLDEPEIPEVYKENLKNTELPFDLDTAIVSIEKFLCR